MTKRRPVAAGRWRRRLPAILAAALLAVGASAAPVAAHNVLISSSPGDGASVPQTPAAVVLTFDEPAISMGTQVLVSGPSGQVQQGVPRLVDNTVTQGLTPGAPAGVYTVAWRVTSLDGHPISGTLTFTALAAGAGQPATVPAPDGPDSSTRPIPWWMWTVMAFVVAATGVAVAKAVRRARSRGV